MDRFAPSLPASGDLPASHYRDIGSRLAKLRSARGWQQRELSRRAHFDPPRLSRIERGIARVTLPELVRLGRALDAGLDELVFGHPESLEGEWAHLLRELEKTLTREEEACAKRLLRALVLGLRGLQRGAESAAAAPC
ncbi:MAG TPA: helix-turn-helix transcriptional regulator [Thermoanaerobaculia bacterium]|jgi:transcriptional regulator with XRE-family HTH domain|nr:helix-turn-helix transcriptional regulator [Thermoanaerobaculia bacterium]